MKTMENLMETKTPIGAVVKKVDSAFSNLVRAVPGIGSFNRVEWQFLSFIKKNKKAESQEIFEFLSFFESPGNIEKLISRFAGEGWVDDEQGIFTITTKGEDAFYGVEKVQKTIIHKAFAGIDPEHYDTTIHTLEKVLNNLREFIPAETQTQVISNPSEISPGSSEEVQLINQFIARVEMAHNQKDPEAFAELFADRATFVNAMGKRLSGKDAIYQSAKGVMKTFLAKSFARYEIVEIKFLKSDIALVHINQHPIDATGELQSGETGGTPTYILVKDVAGDWKIMAGQNTLTTKVT